MDGWELCKQRELGDQSVGKQRNRKHGMKYETKMTGIIFGNLRELWDLRIRGRTNQQEQRSIGNETLEPRKLGAQVDRTRGSR